jgi:hypothetical protein
MARSRSVLRSRRGRSIGKVTSLVVVIAVEELFRALLGAEEATEGVRRTRVADPPETDRALLEKLVQLTRIAGEAVHGREVYNEARASLLLNL